MTSVRVVSKPSKAFAIPFNDCCSLINAVISGNLDAVKRIIPRSYNVNQRFIIDYNGTQTYLGFLAILYNQPEILEYLIRQNFDMCIKDTKGLNLFMVAANTNYLSTSIIDLLFSSVYEFVDWNEQFENRENNTLLHMAILRKNNYLLNKLLGFNHTYLKVASLRNIYGDSAISLAIKLEMDDVSILLCQSLKPKYEEGWYHVLDHKGDNLLNLAKKHNMEQVFYLLEKLKNIEIDEDVSMRTDIRESSVSEANSVKLNDIIQGISELTVQDCAFELEEYKKKFASIQNNVEKMERDYNEVVKNLLSSQRTKENLKTANIEHQNKIRELIANLEEFEKKIKIINRERENLLKEREMFLLEKEDLTKRHQQFKNLLENYEKQYENSAQEDKLHVENLVQRMKEKDEEIRVKDLECDMLKDNLIKLENKYSTLEKNLGEYKLKYKKLQGWLTLFEEREKKMVDSFTLKEKEWETMRTEWKNKLEVWTQKEKKMKTEIEDLSKKIEFVLEPPQDNETIIRLKEDIKQRNMELQKNEIFIKELKESIKKYAKIEEKEKEQEIKLQKLEIELEISKEECKDLVQKNRALEDKYSSLISEHDTLSSTMSSLNNSMTDTNNKLEATEETNLLLQQELSNTNKEFEKEKKKYRRIIEDLKTDLIKREEEYQITENSFKTEKKRLEIYIKELKETWTTKEQELTDQHNTTIGILKTIHGNKLAEEKRTHEINLKNVHDDYIEALNERDTIKDNKFREMEETLQQTINDLSFKTDQLEEENRLLKKQIEKIENPF